MDTHRTRRAPIVIAGLALALGLTSGSPVAGQPKRPFFSGGIVNQASGKALDVQDKSAQDGANVQQWEFAGAANQLWDVIDQGQGRYSIVNRASGKGLDVTNSNPADGVNIQQFRFANVDNQLWRLEASGPLYKIVNVATGKCLDVEAPRVKDNGANVQQWSCSGQPNQLWRFTPK